MSAGTFGRTGTGLPPRERRWDFPWHLAPAAAPLDPSAAEVPEPPAGARRPAAVLFDIGLTLIHPSGTVMLADTRAEVPGFDAPPHDLAAALLLAAEARHLPLPRGLDGDGKVSVTWGMLLGLSPDQAARVWLRMMARQDLYCELDPEAEEVLAGLRRRGIKAAAVSNSDGTLGPELRHFGLDGYFDAVVDSTAVAVEKPARAIYQAALDALSVPADACWFVGDGLVNDVLGARRAGIALGVLYDRFGVHTRLPEVPRVGRLTRLLDWLDELDEPNEPNEPDRGDPAEGHPR